jgi:hypothetical protein
MTKGRACPPPCGKRRYATKEMAVAVIQMKQQTRDGERVESRAYYRPECGWWHLTSRESPS